MGFCALFYTGKPNRRLTDSNMKGLIRSKLIAAMLTASLLVTHAGAYVSAEEAGDMKPSNEFFEKFFSKIQYYEKNSMLIVGDELDKDILGGIKNGIDSCWFNWI